jgi:hypothetical protein
MCTPVAACCTPVRINIGADPHILDKSGRRFVATLLAGEYGFTDLGGACPPVPSYAQYHGEQAV